MNKYLGVLAGFAFLNLPTLPKAQAEPLALSVSNAARIPVVESSAARVVMTREDFARLGHPTTLAEVLRLGTGMAISQSGGLGTLANMRLRGAESNQILLVIDGVPANNPAAGSSYDPAHLALETVERIEIVKGEQSAVRGSDAMGGVIYITTRRGQGQSAALSYASENTRRASAALNHQHGAFAVGLQLSTLHSDGISAADSRRFSYLDEQGERINVGGASEDDAYHNNALNSYLRFAHEGLNLEAGFYLSNFTSHYDDFVSGVGPVDSTATYMKGLERRYYLRADHSRDSMAQHLMLARQEHQHDYYSSYDMSTADGQSDFFSYDIDLGLDRPHRFNFALSHQRDTMDGSFSGKRAAEHQAISAEYQYHFAQGHLRANLRHHFNHDFADHTSGQLGLLWNLSSDWQLTFNVGTGRKHPTLTELYGFDRSYPGNKNLKAEKSLGGDAALRWHNGTSDLKLGVFYRWVDDLIDGSGTYAVNLDERSTIRGVELDASHQWNALDLALHYTYTDSDTPSGRELLRQPRHLVQWQGAYHFNDAWQLSFDQNFSSARDDVFFKKDYSSSRVRLPSYAVSNLHVNYRFHPHWQMQVGINNLFDKDYEELLGYGTPRRNFGLYFSGEF